ncbi:MAG: DNA polymerase [Planctomycetota bacterium]
MDLWDVYPYFDSSLDGAANKYLGEGKAGIPKAWLADLLPHLRDAEHRARVELYCKRDAGLTERLWHIVRDQYLEIGVSPYRVASPAGIAKRIFPTQYNMKGIPGWVQRVFWRSVYGGRSETHQRGNVGKAYAYDIHSAYPSIIRKLYDPRRGVALPCPDGPRDGVLYGAYCVTVKVPIDETLAPVPVRRKVGAGGILFPCGVFTTWITRTELDVLREFNYDHTVRWGVEILPEGRRRRLFPAGAIEELYRLRKQNPALNIAIKKTINSLYGKYAEKRPIWVPHVEGPVPPGARRVGPGRYQYRKDIPTPNTCYPVAAEILAQTRVRLWRAMRAAGDGIVCCMTDGFVTTKIPRLDDRGPGLGQWGLDRTCEEFVAVGTGIYFYRVGGEWKAKRRGIPDPRFFDMVHHHPAKTVRVPILCARTLAEAARNGYRNLNVMERRKRAIDVNLDRSRYWPDEMESWHALFGNRQRSFPWILATGDLKGRA